MGYFGGMGRKMGFFFEKVGKWGATLIRVRMFSIIFNVASSIMGID